MDTPNIQFPSGVPYLEGERGTTAEAVKDIQLAVPPVTIGSIDFETDPIPGVGGGNAPWLTTVSNPHTGLRCFRSGAITNSQQSLWTFTPPLGAVNISFWWRVSSEAGFDFLEVYLNSVTPVNRILQQSGTANIWTFATLALAGATSIIFRYVKDSSDSAGLDAVFIDDIEWISDFVPAIQNYEPLHLDINNNLKVTMMDGLDSVTGFDHFLDCTTDSVTICQDSPLQVDVLNFPASVTGRALDCETDSVTICTDDPLEVEVLNFPPPITGLDVNVIGFPSLDCETDSVTICQDGPLEVEVLNFPPPVTGTLQVQIIDEPVAVTGTVEISNQPKQYAEDTQAVSGDLGFLLLAQRHDPNTGTVNADNDYSALHVNEFGQLKVTVGGQTILIGNTVTVVQGKRSLRGLYYAASGPIAYTTAADGATGGDIWLVNTSPSVVAYIRSVKFTVMINSLALLTSLPTIRMERMTFTGTPSGTLVTPAIRDTLDLANTATVRSTAAGMAITAGPAIDSFAPAASDVIGGLLAVNAASAVPVEQTFEPDLDGYIALRQNQGVVFRQHTAGSATENRQYWLNIAWEEI